uniref:Enolase 4 n=1 Tax=Panthera leo TaxID=9689 RepID=A0A8C9DCF7_PANLE
MGEEGGGRSCGTTRELQKLKQQAMEYYRENDVPRRLEELLNSTFYLQPADVYGHLANCFSKLAKPPTICKVVGRNVLDGLGLPTLQVEIFCTIQNFPKNICSVVISTHFEVRENALPEQAEAEEVERSEAVSTAVQWVNKTITEELRGIAPSMEASSTNVSLFFFFHPTDTLTEKPILPPEPVEPVLSGSMAIGAVSLAVAKTSAMLDNNPLYLNIALLKHPQEQPTKLTIPLLMVSLVSCGKSSPGKLNLMKEVICIPHPGLTAKQGVEMLLEIQKHINKTIEMVCKEDLWYGIQPITGKMSHLGCLTINYDTIEQPLLLIEGICANLGLDLGTNLHLAINCAAHELIDYSRGKYEVMTGTYKNAAEMADLYGDLISRFPSIIALIDPFRKEDSEQWDSIYNALGSRCYIIAGTTSKSISKLLENGNISIPKSSGLIIKHTNQTTMSDLVQITNLLDSKKHIAVFGSTEGESSDDSLVDLAIGLGVRFIKLGGLSRGERVTKYNRLFTIEEELVQKGALGFNEEHTFFSLHEEAEKATVAGGPPELLEPIFPTEVMEGLAKA